jgi:ankyrin repeat protein
MDTESFKNACNGKSASAGGLNLPEFKRETSQLYPAHKIEINSMSRKQLEAFCKQQERAQSPVRSPGLRSSSSQSKLFPAVPSQVRSSSPLRSVSSQIRLPSPSVRSTSRPVKVTTKPERMNLDTAIQYNNLEAINTILNEEHINLNRVDNIGWTPLTFAGKRGTVDTVKMLLDHGADVNFQNNYGLTALMTASSDRNVDVIKLLIQYGADVNIKDRNGETALIMAASSSGNVDAIKLLIQYGADLYIKDNNGNTALHHAVLNHNLKNIEILLQEGGDDTLLNNYGLTPLDIAKRQNNNAIISLFQKYEPDIKEPGYD